MEAEDDDVIGSRPQPEPDCIEMEVSSNQNTASCSKIETIVTDTPSQKDYHITGNRIVDMEILDGIIKTLHCPECNTDRLKLYECFKRKQGFASMLKLKCRCGFEKVFYTSKQQGKGFEINKRFVYGMRSCGRGYTSLEKLTALLNMPRPLTKKNYNIIIKKVTAAVIEVANETMIDAGNEIKSKATDNNNEIIDTAVSVDGSWQKRGFGSVFRRLPMLG